ncbi:MAG: polysulfide reductase NrfD [Acidobacteria bacterium]|nr:polysulfide reductase NrfD [Acidobacteriota bacterium]
MATYQLSYTDVNRDVLRILRRPGWPYFALLAILILFVSWGAFAWVVQIQRGMGVAGINHPVFWGVYITNFVFWVGIAHSGTLISAILFLLRARWRTAVFRTAEAMTVFAIMTAGLYPLIHLGRVWKFYWLIPYPNQRELWINFRSPLTWDVLAVLTYFIVSSLFLYVGLLPDIKAAHDAVRGWRRRIYGILSLGWRGTVRQWKHFSTAYLFLAALATPLVVSVHSIVSWDFAMSVVPGWHSTIFAPYFVAGAIHSGLAMVLTLLIPIRKMFRMEHYITTDHFENLAKLIVVTGWIMTYAYVTEFLIAWYSANTFEQSIFIYRALGDYAVAFWIMILFNSVIPLFFLIRPLRRNLVTLMVISLMINVGMWFERFVIIVGSLSHEFLPYDWGFYRPTWVEIGISLGSLAWFLMWLLLFLKFFPAVAIAEVKETLLSPAKEH